MSFNRVNDCIEMSSSSIHLPVATLTCPAATFSCPGIVSHLDNGIAQLGHVRCCYEPAGHGRHLTGCTGSNLGLLRRTTQRQLSLKRLRPTRLARDAASGRRTGHQIQRDAGAPLRLASVERHIGMLDQFIDCGTIAVAGDARTEAQRDIFIPIFE